MLRVRLALRFDCGQGAFQEGSVYMNDGWMEKLLADRENKRRDSERSSQLSSMATNATPDMLSRLSAQVAADTKKYAESTGDASISCETIPAAYADGFQVDRRALPTFSLNVGIDTSGIRYRETRRTSSSSPQAVSREGTILIMARGQDELYYRIEGKDYGCESEVSEYFLRPLLSLLGA